MVICVGEILADMMAKSSGESICFECFAGGAPFNVACGIARLGGDAGFYGCVGEDSTGDFLADFAEKQPLLYRNIIRDKERNTTLSFVELNRDGERKFRFYRKHTADSRLRIADIPEIVNSADIIHLGSLPISEADGRAFYGALIKAARKSGKRISFDVNFRGDIFPDIDTAKEIYSTYLCAADIIKLSQEELFLFAGESSLRRGMEKLARGEDKIIFVTLGCDGSAYLYKDKFERTRSLPVKVADTTGAGDAFFAGALSQIDSSGTDNLHEALVIGSICGSLATEKKGAISAFPSKEEVLSKRAEIK